MHSTYQRSFEIQTNFFTAGTDTPKKWNPSYQIYINCVQIVVTFNNKRETTHLNIVGNFRDSTNWVKKHCKILLINFDLKITNIYKRNKKKWA